jgi:hypothetical protein
MLKGVDFLDASGWVMLHLFQGRRKEIVMRSLSRAFIEICDVVLRLLAASIVQSVTLDGVLVILH